MIDNDDIAMVGAMYDVHSGIVQYKNYESELVALKGAENTPLAEKLNGVLKLAKITNS
jgi:carbonic anhydrase